MGKSKKQLAVFPGTFDPITNGHLNVIRRAAGLFDELVVAVGENPDKSFMLSHDQRVAMVEQVTADIPNVRVASYSGLTIDLAHQLAADVMVRAIRDSVDLHGEIQMAETNRNAGNIETLFLVTGAQFGYISASLVRQIAAGGGDVSGMVPQQAMSFITEAACKA
ncbi:MAG: pantetheine-phosphate adenylyltransferase [Planctomycetota bacterium]|jgi:pantetheine-phosphate adenylyltransferase